MINVTPTASKRSLFHPEDDSGSFGTGVTSSKEPVFSSDCDDPEDTLGKIVIYIKITIFRVSIQSDPLSTGVTYYLADGTFGKNLKQNLWTSDISDTKSPLSEAKKHPDFQG